MSSGGRTLYQLGFQVSPILFTGGIAQSIPGKTLPIIVLTQAASFLNGLLQGSATLNPDNFFASFMPLPGSTLAANQIGMYPFANQITAANAIIAQPLNVSLKMTIPSRQPGDMIVRLATMTALQAAIANHTRSGGTYTIATPNYLYTNCILTSLRDITGGDRNQQMIEYQWDFVQPLISQGQAQTAQNSLMGLISGALPISGMPSWSGAFSSVGSALSGAVSSVIPSASNLVGTLAGSGPAGAAVNFLTGGSNSTGSAIASGTGGLSGF